MTVFDWIVFALIGWSFAKGYWMGFIKEILSLMAWILGLVFATLYASDLGAALPLSGASAGLRNLIGFVLIFLLISILLSVLARALKQMVSAVGLGWADRLLGSMFGLFKTTILLFLVTFVVTSTPLEQMDFWQNSWVAKELEQAFGVVKLITPIDLGKYVT
jgi:membrane protein required for colicin V production